MMGGRHTAVITRLRNQCAELRAHGCWRCVPMLLVVLCVKAVWLVSVVGDEPEAGLQLPASSHDILELRTAEGLRPRVLTGLIEDLSANSVVFRLTSGQTQVLQLRQLRAIRFVRSEVWEEGLSLMQQRRYRAALPKLEQGLSREARPWALREIRGDLAVCQRAAGESQQCLATVEQILESDPETRHILALPLLWDERLVADAGLRVVPADLSAKSLARQLTAASVLLGDETAGVQSESTLRSLRRSGRSNFGLLAELQLWRLRLLRGGPELLEAESWQQRSVELDRWTRGPAELLIGRALFRLNEDDRAAVSLLWMPLIAPLDPQHCRRALQDAVEVLQRSGRPVEAAGLQEEIAEWTVSPAVQE